MIYRIFRVKRSLFGTLLLLSWIGFASTAASDTRIEFELDWTGFNDERLSYQFLFESGSIPLPIVRIISLSGRSIILGHMTDPILVPSSTTDSPTATTFTISLPQLGSTSLYEIRIDLLNRNDTQNVVSIASLRTITDSDLTPTILEPKTDNSRWEFILDELTDLEGISIDNTSKWESGEAMELSDGTEVMVIDYGNYTQATGWHVISDISGLYSDESALGAINRAAMSMSVLSDNITQDIDDMDYLQGVFIEEPTTEAVQTETSKSGSVTIILPAAPIAALMRHVTSTSIDLSRNDNPLLLEKVSGGYNVDLVAERRKRTEELSRRFGGGEVAWMGEGIATSLFGFNERPPLSISSTPRGAILYIDGVNQNERTQITIRKQKYLWPHIVLRKDGYFPCVLDPEHIRIDPEDQDISMFHCDLAVDQPLASSD